MFHIVEPQSFLRVAYGAFFGWVTIRRGQEIVLERKDNLLEGDYLEAQRLSERIAAEMEQPRFYVDKKDEVETSRVIFDTHPMVQACLDIVREKADRFGHGLAHVYKVAVDAGALVIIEVDEGRPEDERSRMLLLSHIAGVLHDIKRMEPDHALRGAEEAGLILGEFDLEEREREAVVQAIRNHEAFKPAEPLDDPSMQIISDALYDADKFRWGPDNFTETVWMMVAPSKVPLTLLMQHFAPSMKGIEKITGTFRTPTGREYGPDFVAKGLEIGEKLCQVLTATLEADEGDA
jgi:hypothetical protein